MKRICLIVCVAWSCTGKSPTESESYKVNIQPSATFQYVSPKHYTLTVIHSDKQTLAALDAITTAPDLTKFVWESNKTWKFTFVNDTFPIPTLNCCSYSYQNKIRTMVAPVGNMIGDSMYVVVSATIHDRYNIADTIVIRFK